MDLDTDLDTDLEKFTKCDVFTPDYIAKLMTDKIKKTGDLLEPSAGCGHLLKFLSIPQYNSIDVYELKKEYLDQIKDDDTKIINKYNADFIKSPIHKKYDTIVMNPPYIKIQDLSVHYRKYLKDAFPLLKNGMVDIYYAFIIKGLSLLKDDGVMVSITPNAYLYNKSALKLRQYLFDNKYIKEIIDFKDQKIFKKVSVYCCITVYTKTNKSHIIYNNKPILYSDIITNYSLFNLSSNADIRTLKDICKIRNGIATLRDKIFIHAERLNNEPCWKKITNGKTERFIIYPYNDGVIMKEDTFKLDNPLTYAYLCNNKEELSKRDKGNKTYPEWYAYGRSQSIKYSDKKCIYLPCFIDPKSIKRDLIINQHILHHGCLCIEPISTDDDDVIDNIIAYITNHIEFIKQNSSPRSGGWINISSNTLYLIPCK